MAVIGRRLNSVLSADAGYIITEGCSHHIAPPERLLCQWSPREGSYQAINQQAEQWRSCHVAANVCVHVQLLSDRSWISSRFALPFQFMHHPCLYSRTQPRPSFIKHTHFILFVDKMSEAAFIYMGHPFAAVIWFRVSVCIHPSLLFTASWVSSGSDMRSPATMFVLLSHLFNLCLTLLHYLPASHSILNKIPNAFDVVLIKTLRPAVIPWLPKTWTTEYIG